MLEMMFTRLQSFLNLGGPVVGILLFLSIIALAIVLMKLVQFHLARVGVHGPANQAMESWGREGADRARAIALEDTSPVGSVLARGFALVSRSSPLSKTVLEDEMGRIANQQLHQLRKGLRPLDAIGQIAPLLGLFGTVIGMITAFQRLQEAGNAVDPSILAGGIWVALMTTAVGLALAMPISLIVSWFEARIDNERVAMESMATELVSDVTLAKGFRENRTSAVNNRPEPSDQPDVSAHAYAT